MAWLTVEYGTLSRIGLPLPRAGEGGVGVPDENAETRGESPHPPRSPSTSASPASGRGKRKTSMRLVPIIRRAGIDLQRQ
jgi:hypothetical protein